MADRPQLRRGIVAVVLFVVAMLLIEIAATGWSGTLPATVTFAAVFLGPGIGWQNLRGTVRFHPVQMGLASATSVGCVVVTGLVMNALSISLTKGHWAAVLGTGLAALALATATRRPKAPEGSRRTDGEPSRRLAATAVVACCAVLAAGGAGLAWASQKHWLARQHFTELYATGAGGRELITVHNKEGRPVAYRATIVTAGQPAVVASFTLADGGTWTRAVAVPPSRPAGGQAALTVLLNRVGVPGVYRSIRLLRPAPTAPPSP